MPALKELQWTPEENMIIKRLIGEGYRLKDMPPFFPKRTLRGIQCQVYNLGLRSGQPRTKYSKDESFWEIQNPINCYFAGILAADGSINDTQHTIAWECASEDRYYMEELVRLSGFTGPISDFPCKSPRSENVTMHSKVLFAASQKWSNDLKTIFNVTEGKTYRLAPPSFVNDKMACSYIIGYTDGDGCISIAHKDKSILEPVISYTSASKSIVTWIRNFVDDKFPFKIRKRENGKISSSAENTYHHCRIYGLKAIKVFEFLRKIDVPKFARKWDNPEFLDLCAEYRARWPEYFTTEMELYFDGDGNIKSRSTFTNFSVTGGAE